MGHSDTISYWYCKLDTTYTGNTESFEDLNGEYDYGEILKMIMEICMG